jgi:hypothetical protein
MGFPFFLVYRHRAMPGTGLLYPLPTQKEREGKTLSPFLTQLLFCLSGGLGFAELTAIVGHAGLAQAVGQMIRAALGTNVEARGLQLPHGTAALIAALLGHFRLRDCH